MLSLYTSMAHHTHYSHIDSVIQKNVINLYTWGKFGGWENTIKSQFNWKATWAAPTAGREEVEKMA